MAERIQSQPCPHCKESLNFGRAIYGAGIRPGAVALCSHCLKALIFDDTLKLRLMNQEDIDTLPIEILRVLAFAKLEMRASRAARN